jgi:molecular chaperone GrpE (heat shock protein)
MIDPITAVGIATSAFNAIKNGIAVGRDLQDMTGQLSQWGKAISDFNYAEEKSKNPPWYSFKGSDQETALQLFANKRKMEEMRKEIKNFISWHYGPSAWEEVLSIEAKMRKLRKEELYRKEELKRQIIEWTVGILVSVIGIVIMGGIFWFIGKEQGRW